MFRPAKERGRMIMRFIVSRIRILCRLRVRCLFFSFLFVVLILSTSYHVRRHGSSVLFRQSALLAEPVSPPSCEGRWIYIYELEHMFNRDFVSNCSSFKKNINLCSYMENNGMGKGFSFEAEGFGDGVWYNTWQFSLELYFHERLLRYPCIVSSEELADVFYVPFYAGMDLSYYMTHPSLKGFRAKTYMELLEWLRQQYSFIRNGGFDHFFTLGRIALDFRRPKGDSWGTQMLGQPDFQNMVKLTLERDGSTPVHFNNEIAIPYPSYFHPRNNVQIEALVQWALGDSQRPVLVSIAGGRRRVGQGGIREKLMLDCEKDARCTVLVCQGHDGVNQSDLSSRSYSFLPIAGHTLMESCSFPTILLDIFHRSVFCLQPPGDSPSRRSFVDSLLAGCIPVIFKRNSAWSQYTAFLPENGDDYSVLVPIREVRKRNVVHILADIPRWKIQSMRERIKQLLPRILYAHVDRKYPTNAGESSGERVLRGPDAFDIALNEALSLMRKNLDKG